MEPQQKYRIGTISNIILLGGGLKPILQVPNLALSFCNGSVIHIYKQEIRTSCKEIFIHSVVYDSYLLKDVHSVLVNFPREYAQESMMLYI